MCHGSDGQHEVLHLRGELLVLDELAQRIPALSSTQIVHVLIWYMLGPQRGYHTITLGLMYIPYWYLDPVGYRHVGTTQPLSRKPLKALVYTRRYVDPGCEGWFLIFRPRGFS